MKTRGFEKIRFGKNKVCNNGKKKTLEIGFLLLYFKMKQPKIVFKKWNTNI